MTTYTAIPNGDIDRDSPVTQPLLTLMRDNPIGIAEGAANAPRVFMRALEGLTAGDEARITPPNPGAVSVTGTPGPSVFTVAFLQYGVVRFKGTFAPASAGFTVRAIRYRGGAGASVVDSLAIASGATVEFVSDIPVLPGDQVDIRADFATGTHNVTVTGLQLCTNGEDYFPVSQFGNIVNSRSAL